MLHSMNELGGQFFPRGDQLLGELSQVFSVFLRFSQVFSDFAEPRASRPTEHIVHWCTEMTVNYKLTPVQAQWQSGAN